MCKEIFVHLASGILLAKIFSPHPPSPLISTYRGNRKTGRENATPKTSSNNLLHEAREEYTFPRMFICK